MAPDAGAPEIASKILPSARGRIGQRVYDQLFEKDTNLMSAENRHPTPTVDLPSETGPWDPALAQLRAWDPDWADSCVKMTTNPWNSGVLPRKFIELVGIALNAACTNLNPDGTRRHIRAALKAGASREEILFVLKAASLMAIHSCSLGAPILLDEAKAAGVKPPPPSSAATPACNAIKRSGNGIPHGIRSSSSIRRGLTSSLQP